jgi:type I restriction enzyme M protein
VKSLPNEAFGFMRVTVERPLRLRWEVTDGTLAAVGAQKTIAKLSDATREVLLDRLRRHEGLRVIEPAGLGVLTEELEALGCSASVIKAVVAGLAVRDQNAAIVTDRAGDPEPDTELRDNENVPLPPVALTWVGDAAERLSTGAFRDAVDEYLLDEVLPYVPHAWVEHERTRIGYEIPLTRHFYKYVPPRPLAEIDAEITSLEAEIQTLLDQVAE